MASFDPDQPFDVADAPAPTPAPERASFDPEKPFDVAENKPKLTFDSDKPFTPAPEKKASAPMPGILDATWQGIVGGAKDVQQSAATVTGSTAAAIKQEPTPAAEPYEWGDLWEPSRGAAKTAYRIAKSAPTLAAGIAGGAAGAATPVPGGALVGGMTGAGLGAAFQSIGPVFQDELKKTPDDPDGAWTRATEHAAASGVFSALGWGLFPVKVVNGPMKNLAFQALGIQPSVGMAEKATQNVISGKPATEGMGEAYVESAIGTAVPALGHKALEGPKAPVAPQRPQIQDQLLQSADYKANLADQTHVLADQATTTTDQLSLRKQANDLDAEAAHDRFLGNLPPPEARSDNFLGKAKDTWVNNFQPELFSDHALLADAKVAEYKSNKAQAEDSIMARADERRYDWNKVPEEDRYDFFKAFETDPKTWTPDFKQRYDDLVKQYPFIPDDAKTLRSWLFDSYMAEKDWGSKADYIINYLPHAFQQPSKAQTFFENAISQQGLGPSWFQKARYYDTVELARQNGLELKSTNPFDLVTMRLMSGADMKAKMQLLDGLHDMGMAIPKEKAPQFLMAKMGSSLPWQEIGAPNGDRWMIAPDAQALWKNGVEAKGLWADQGAVGDAYRGWMTLKNAWVPIKLGLSLFHPVHVAHISVWNNLNRGLQEAFGKGQQSLTDRIKAVPQAAVNTLLDPILAYPWRVPFTNIKPPASSHVGKEISEAWRTHPDEQSPRQQDLTRMMNESGISAQLSEQLRVQGEKQFWDAMQQGNYHKAIIPALGYGLKSLTKPIFESWIPNLKTAAVARETESLYRRRPDLMNDPDKRAIAMRAIGKQVDNRFGEMFYGGLFWNRMIKDASIGSFLSLGWNLGFAREFVGGALEPTVRRFMDAPTPNRQIVRDVTSKTSNAFGYAMTAMMFNGVMNYAFTGQYPQDGWDMIFPRIGGLNPDGSPRRVTNAFYTREVPMVMKHIDEQQSVKGGLLETLKNKLMFSPFIEMGSNHDYFGNQIWDENSPYWQQWGQFAKHLVSEQMNPMALAGAKRALQLSGKPFGFKDVVAAAAQGDRDVVMPLMGFGPAPSYASRDSVQNRIMYLARKYVYPEQKPYKEAEKMKERGDAVTAYKQARQSGDPVKIGEAAKELAKTGMASAQIQKVQPGQEIRNMFQRLGSVAPSQQTDLLKRMSPEQFRFYYPASNKKKVMADPDIRELAKRYYAQ